MAGEGCPDGFDECRWPRGVHVKRFEVWVISQYSLMNPTQSLVSGLGLGRLR